MVREFSKLMLRAYNNEADNAVRSMKPYTLDSSVARLDKARETITRLGGTMNILVTDPYHRLRVEELELTADYLAKVAEEKDRDREERARLREEEIARREYEREQERLRKEQAHYEATVAALRDNGDLDGAARPRPSSPRSRTRSTASTAAPPTSAPGTCTSSPTSARSAPTSSRSA